MECECGCGLPLEGRRTKWATDRCRNRGNGTKKRKLDIGGAGMRDRLLKHRYNITQEDFDKVLEFQGGGCALCGKKNNKNRNHHVDHDHKTMVVRGILCFRCNVHVLGKLTLEQVEAALEYLKNPPAYQIVGMVVSNPISNKKRKRRRGRKS